ncbi:MAG TPA: hypothetical protein VEX70_01920 [Pyrinomonadaceae bacterium]|jgi:hypothetical protein|nr:hypothetical protein [Pyrinomonadaceae bacterium]
MTIRHPLRDRHKKRQKADTAQLAAQLAPLEEQDKHAAARQSGNGRSGAAQNGGRLIQEHGALIVDTDNLHLPVELTEAGKGRIWEIESVVLVIVGAMLAFIAFIAWQISRMPTVG